MSRKRNTFSKAVKHLKSSKIEEKLQTLNEIPTMNTSGLYDVVPGALSRTEIDKDNPTVPDYSTIDWDIDGEDGRDTSGLFDAEGNSLFVAPPGDNSYILGPMAAMYYTWSYPWTMIGYIRESDRRMVNLGRIDGKLSDWDGSSGNASSGSGTFSSYGQLTLEQAVWFRDVQKNPGATNDPATYNYRAFYPGPPSNTPDAFGRYYCITTGEPLATKDNEKEVNPMELQPSDVLAAILDRQRRGKTLSKAEKEFLKNRLPDPRSIKGNRMMKEALVMPPDLFKEKYGLDPEEVTEYYRNVHGTEVTATPPPPASTAGLDARAIKLGYNDPSYPVNPDGYYNQQLTNAEEILQSLLDAEFYASLARGDSPNYSNAEISKAKADLEKAKKERENWEKWKDDNDYQWQGDIQTTADKPESLEQQKQEVEEVRQSLETGEGINWDKVWTMIDAGLLAWDAVSMAGVMFPELGSSIVGGLGLGVGRILRGARNLIKGASTTRKVLKGPKTTSKPNKTTGGAGKFDPTGQNIELPDIPGLAGNPTGKPPTPIKRHDGKPFDPLPPKKLGISEPLGSPTSKGSPGSKRPFDLPRDFKPSKPANVTKGKGKTPKPTDADTQYSPNIFTRGRTQRNDPWIDRGASSEKTAKTISDLVKDNLKGVDRQRTSTAPDAAWNPLRGMPGYGTLKGKVNPRINKINQARAKRGKGPLSADQINPGGFQTGPDEASRRLFKGVGKLAGNVGKSNVSKNVSQRKGKKVNRRGRSIKESFLLEEIQSTDDAQQYMVDRLLKFIKDPKFVKNLDKIISKLDSYEKKSKKKNVKESYLSEERKTNILKNLKNPVVLPESKKKHKVKPGQRYKGKTNFQGMDKLIGDVKPQDPFKKERSAWSKDWQGYNAKLSQEKKNQVLELVGDGKHYFDYMINDSKIKNAEEMEKFWGLNPELYSYVMGGKKYKATRKEQVRGDYLVFLTDENGEKTSMLQSDISIKLEEEHQKEMIAEYNKTAEPTPFLKDPLMKKVAKRLKNEIDYPDKPAKKGYPDEPPPKQVDGWHPEYGKKYKYDKLDPVSAVMMRRAPTGDPEIDANVKKASMKPKVEKKTSNWREELEV